MIFKTREIWNDWHWRPPNSMRSTSCTRANNISRQSTRANIQEWKFRGELILAIKRAKSNNGGLKTQFPKTQDKVVMKKMEKTWTKRSNTLVRRNCEECQNGNEKPWHKPAFQAVNLVIKRERKDKDSRKPSLGKRTLERRERRLRSQRHQKDTLGKGFVEDKEVVRCTNTNKTILRKDEDRKCGEALSLRERR